MVWELDSSEILKIKLEIESLEKWGDREKIINSEIRFKRGKEERKNNFLFKKIYYDHNIFINYKYHIIVTSESKFIIEIIF